MQIQDVKQLVEQKDVPAEVQKDTILKATKLVKDGFDIEVIVTLTSVTLDVYSEDGVLVDKIKTKFRKVNPFNNTN